MDFSIFQLFKDQLEALSKGIKVVIIEAISINILYGSIADGVLYNFVFECNSIRAAVRPEIASVSRYLGHQLAKLKASG